MRWLLCLILVVVTIGFWDKLAELQKSLPIVVLMLGAINALFSYWSESGKG